MLEQVALKKFRDMPTDAGMENLLRQADEAELDLLFVGIIESPEVWKKLSDYQKGRMYFISARHVEADYFLQKAFDVQKNTQTQNLLFRVACERNDIKKAGLILNQILSSSTDTLERGRAKIAFALMSGQNIVAAQVAKKELFSLFGRDVVVDGLVVEAALRTNDVGLLSTVLAKTNGQQVSARLSRSYKNTAKKMLNLSLLELFKERVGQL